MSAVEPFTLSVVIPTHGNRASVADTVRALLQEPRDALEVIVVSDGDPSFAEQCLGEVQDERLRMASQPKAGSAAARNLGLSLSRHEWVAFVDDDDIPRPNWFSVWAEHARDECVVITACVKHWRGGEVFKDKRCCSLDLSDPTMGASSLLAGAFTVRKSALQAIGGYDLSLRASQNHDLGLRLLEHLQGEGEAGRGSVTNTGEIVLEVFTERAGARRQRYGSGRAEAAKIFQKRFADRLAADPTHAASLHRIVARSALDRGDAGEFRRSALAALRERPTEVANWKFLIGAVSPMRVARFMANRGSEV